MFKDVYEFMEKNKFIYYTSTGSDSSKVFAKMIFRMDVPVLWQLNKKEVPSLLPKNVKVVLWAPQQKVLGKINKIQLL